VLAEFRKLSGLECNVEKSYVMRIGDLTGEVEQNILDLGFPFVDEITILGFTLQNYGDMAAKNFEKITSKVLNIVRFWERFNLTLPGKISIYKTLLLPQINFVSSVLSPSELVLNELSNTMESFVKKGLNISKSRIYEKIENGCIGMFNLKTFIAALQCSWIKRAESSTNDNWKVTLKKLGNGKVSCCHTGDYTNLGIGLKNIISSYSTFVNSYMRQGSNFYFDKIYKCSRYGTGRDQNEKFDENFFGPELLNLYEERIVDLTWHQLIVNDLFVPFQEFSFITGILIDRPRYNKLKNCFVLLKKNVLYN
jgi:hypothetical protein